MIETHWSTLFSIMNWTQIEFLVARQGSRELELKDLRGLADFPVSGNAFLEALDTSVTQPTQVRFGELEACAVLAQRRERVNVKCLNWLLPEPLEVSLKPGLERAERI